MDNGKQQIIVAGVGGQGVLFATRVILETARRMQQPVIGSETHGMSQRGGSVASHVKIGGFRNPLVGSGSADLVIALHHLESYRNFHFLRPGGRCVLNAGNLSFLDPGVGRALAGMDVELHAVDAMAEALALKAPVSANLVVLGYCAGKGLLPFAVEDWSACVQELSPERFLPTNRKAFDRGLELASQ
jgi:indolepyruvate ferredoxin oxidoreductase beta subunit